MHTHEEYMQLALAEARKAAAMDEIPIGAVLVHEGKVIASAHNMRETWQDGTAHAEIIVIQEACKKLARWRLSGCSLYVTVEPCPMCSGAIINSRIKRVVYGASDPKAGCCGGLTDLFALPFNHHPIIEKGLCEEEASALMRAFFESLRQKRLAAKKAKEESCHE